MQNDQPLMPVSASSSVLCRLKSTLSILCVDAHVKRMLEYTLKPTGMAVRRR